MFLKFLKDSTDQILIIISYTTTNKFNYGIILSLRIGNYLYVLALQIVRLHLALILRSSKKSSVHELWLPNVIIYEKPQESYFS